MSRKSKMRMASVMVLAAAAMPVVALGQYQTANNTGRRLDANNRLGSGGMNDSRQAVGGVSADDIVYGNVTRGQAFQGELNSTDATRFRGNLDRPSDNLVRDAGPSVYGRGGSSDQYSAQAFFGDNRGVRPPEGFQRLTPGSTGAFAVVPETYRIPGDLRMDAAIPNPDVSVAQPPQYIVPGAVPSGEPNGAVVPMSDQPWLLGPEMQQRDLLQRLNLDEGRIREMRDELLKSATSEGGEGASANPNDLTVAPETPTNKAMGSSVKSDVAAQAVLGSLNTQQSMRQQLVSVPSPAQQSAQYADLAARLDWFNKRKAMTDEEASREFRKQWQDAQEKQKEEQATQQAAGVTQQPQAAMAPSKLPDATDEEIAANALRARRLATVRGQGAAESPDKGLMTVQPPISYRISSFAEGVKATGLKKLLSDAEKAMQAGKFTQALDYYDGAATVAPNQPLIVMGKAIAELGAGYYARAQIHLEQALSANSALLMARYDLKVFYGEDRLAYLVRDLKDLAQSESRQSRPLFLLAFIAYSTENPQRAEDYLDLAQKRGGSKEFYDKLRDYWQLNGETQKPGPATKPAAAPAFAPVQVPGNK